jgi:hypothetical protein
LGGGGREEKGGEREGKRRKEEWEESRGEIEGGLERYIMIISVASSNSYLVWINWIYSRLGNGNWGRKK